MQKSEVQQAKMKINLVGTISAVKPRTHPAKGARKGKVKNLVRLVSDQEPNEAVLE